MYIVLHKSMEMILKNIMTNNLNLYMNKQRNLPNVNYIGYKPNEYIREMMPNYDMFVYPSIFEETSCALSFRGISFWCSCNYK